MKITKDIHHAMLVAERYAKANKIVADAENAVNQCFYIGWNLLTDEEAVILRKAQRTLHDIQQRTTSQQSHEYVNSLTATTAAD